MKIVLGSDHGGFEYKCEIKKMLIEQGYEVIDVGTNTNKEPSSWSEFGVKTALKIANKEADFGIAFCRSGQGVCISANKVKGVYCGLPFDDKTVEMMRKHDGCNMMAIAADYITIDIAKKWIMLFLNTEFEGGRHEQRLNQLKNFENFGKI